MDEALIAFFLLFVVMSGILAFSAAVRTAKQNRKWTGPEPEQQEPSQAKPKQEKPKVQPPTPPAFETVEPPDRQGWDSSADFHEGEDPCHDDMATAAPTPPEPVQSVFRLKTDELVRGFVIGEILNRKRR